MLFHHGSLVIPTSNGADLEGIRWVEHSPLHTLWAGREAVFVFFVLSGVALTLSVLGGRSQWRAYYPTRLLRLYLPVLGAVLVGFLVTAAVPRQFEPGQSAWMRTHQFDATPWTFLRDAVLVTGTSTLNTPLWSLRWEVFFSLLLPAYVWVALRMRRHWAALAALVVVVVTAGSVLGEPALLYLPMFMVGVVIAVHVPDRIEAMGSRLRGAVGWWFFVAAVLGISSSYWAAAVLHHHVETITFPVVLAAAALLVVLALAWDPARRVLSSPVFQWTGRISFSLYLTHELVVVSVGQLLPSEILGLTPVLSSPMALLLAVAFHRAVESPSHRLSQRVGRRIRT